MKMETIGNILHKDYLLLQDFDLLSPELDQNLQKHAQYIATCNFAEFIILIPYQTPQPTINTIDRFIQTQNTLGAIEYYIAVNNQSQFDKDIESIPQLATKKCIAILPSEDLRYEILAKRIWNLSMGGKAIMILQPERVTQWRKNHSLFKRIHLRGADLAFSGTSEYSLGLFHKRTLRSFHEARIIAMWLTPQIYDVNSALFKKDMAIRLNVIQSLKTPPNDL
jgi:hypothetical protein